MPQVEPQLLDAATVEDIIRWYIREGGTSGTMRLASAFTQGVVSFSPWGIRDQIGMILAQCPNGVTAGNPFRDDARITVVERAIIAEVEYERERQAVANLQALQGDRVWPETIEMQRWRDLWWRMAQRYRADPTWPEAMLWLRQAFGRLVHGDPARGVSRDAAFLVYVTGA